MTIADQYRQATAELASFGDALDEEDINAACLAIAQAHHVMVYGCGREGLLLQGFAMRLAQLGLPVSVQGDMAAPRLGQRDLFLTSAGAGAAPSVSTLCRAARAGGAEVVYLTADPPRMPAGLSNLTLILPSRTLVADDDAAVPPGALYEGALFLLLDVMARRLMNLCEQTPQTMKARQSNIQ